MWITCELGDYDDNLPVFQLALVKVLAGDVKEGKTMLLDISQHIRYTGELKSVTWLLGLVEEALRKVEEEEERGLREALLKG